MKHEFVISVESEDDAEKVQSSITFALFERGLNGRIIQPLAEQHQTQIEFLNKTISENEMICGHNTLAVPSVVLREIYGIRK